MNVFSFYIIPILSPFLYLKLPSETKKQRCSADSVSVSAITSRVLTCSGTLLTFGHVKMKGTDSDLKKLKA